MGAGHGKWAVDVIEAAYRPAADDEAWLTGLLEAARPDLDQGFGAVAMQFDVDASGQSSFGKFVALDCPPRWREAFTATLADPTGEWPRAILQTGPCTTGGRAWAIARGHRERIQAALGLIGAKDAMAVMAVDPGGVAVALNAPRANLERVPRAARQRWARLAAHLAAGRRLRALGAAASLDDAEAIFDPRGKLQHAAEPATSPSARAALRDAAAAVVRASSQLRRRDPDAAVALWQALFAGRWSLLDHFDSDGKRFLVARKNDPAAPQPALLTLRERQVACYAAVGHSNKLIAYELGLSPSTVATHLSAAARKLGVASRVALIRALSGG